SVCFRAFTAISPRRYGSRMGPRLPRRDADPTAEQPAYSGERGQDAFRKVVHRKMGGPVVGPLDHESRGRHRRLQNLHPAQPDVRWILTDQPVPVLQPLEEVAGGGG